MSFSSTLKIDSKACAGVSFTIRRMGLAPRADLDLRCLDLRQRQREIELDYPPQTEEEKRLSSALAIARKKALAVPADEMEGVFTGEVMPIAEQLAGAAPPDVKRARSRFDLEYASIDARIRVRTILAGLLKLEGGDVDGWTPEQLVEAGSAELALLALEIFDAISAECRLPGADAKNSGSPSTSNGPVDSATSNLTAPDAGGPASTPTATVSSTSRAT